ncbi:hypothetical protein SBA2_30137 [Acidobacteriia bacterium SbA2]|nr:hypothetical protein SBA2_30137 [Acidobacteriia bacterium SbA2]
MSAGTSFGVAPRPVGASADPSLCSGQALKVGATSQIRTLPANRCGEVVSREETSGLDLSSSNSRLTVKGIDS